MRVRGGLAGPCVAGVLLLLVAACSTSNPKSSAPSPSPQSSSPSPSASTRLPSDLVGMWKVTDAAREPAGSVLRVDASTGQELVLFRSCGEFSGGWIASPSGSFLGLLSGYSMACQRSVGGGDPSPPWLLRARSFAVHGTERDLLAANGQVLARLLPGGNPGRRTDIIASELLPPTPTAAQRKTLDTVAKPLPEGSAPITAATLAGRWRPYPVRQYDTSQQPYFAFAANGVWSGTDGCNLLGGTLRFGPAGEILNASGAFAGVGCDGPVMDVPTWGRAGISGTTLTLYDTKGNVLGTYVRLA